MRKNRQSQVSPPALGDASLVEDASQQPMRGGIIPKVSDLVKNGQVARFLFYRDGFLMYEVVDADFQFPIPIEDTGKGTFSSEHLAITLMRWIRKQIETQKHAQDRQT